MLETTGATDEDDCQYRGQEAIHPNALPKFNIALIFLGGFQAVQLH